MFIPSGKDEGAVEFQLPRIETLSEKQIIGITQCHSLVSAMDGGKSAEEAIKLVQRQFPEFKRSKRWAQKLFKNYKQGGVNALFDGRLKNQNQNSVLNSDVQRLVLEWWYGRPAAGHKEVWRKVVEECGIRNLPVPAYITVQKFLKGQSEANKLVRAGKIKTWDKQGRPVVRFNLTHYSNQRWQIDHTRLDIWVRVWVEGRWTLKKADWIPPHWEPREVWLTVVLDAHSRSIAGFVVSSKYPDAWTTATLLRKAILPKENPLWHNSGIPSVLQPDRGTDFMSHAVQASVARIGTIFDPDPPYYPNRKGKIERFFLTLDHHLRILSGHHKAVGKSFAAAQKKVGVLCTREMIQSEIEHWIVTEYHQRENAETKRKPAELWEETVQLRIPESEEVLDSFLLKSDKIRKIRNTGIDFHIPGKGTEDRGGRYWSPELAWFYNREVRISYNPEDLASILVYCSTTNEYIGEVWLMGDKNSKYSIADIKQARGQARRGLLQRQKMYSAAIHEQDRKMAKRENWRRARKTQDEQQLKPEKSAKPQKSNVVPIAAESLKSSRIVELNALLDKFEATDKGDTYE